jgi:large subunit ribosomal protein L1
MATKVNWQELYSDLSPSLAQKLRDARIKEDKLKKMPDGEILSIEGVGAAALEKIRQAYPVSSVEETSIKDQEKKVAKKTNKTKKNKTDDSKEETSKKSTQGKKKAPATPKKIKTVSKRLQALRKKVRSDKPYSLDQAIGLLQKITKKRKVNTIELHLNTLDTGIRGEVSLPHSIGKKQKIEIFNDKTIVKINAGKLDFDTLLASPKDMPNLAKYAKILGPKGLMPSPKNGNLTGDPEKRQKELLSGATLAYRTESKFPIIHLALGKSTQKKDHLVQNISALIKHVNPSKVKSAFLTSTQSPSLKLDISSI